MSKKVFKKVCVECGRPLFLCPSGLVCENGHGFGTQGPFDMKEFDAADWDAQRLKWEGRIRDSFRRTLAPGLC